MKVRDFNNINSVCEKLLIVKFNFKLTFNSHVPHFRKNAS